ncbi:protein ILRUN isoform X1 [Lethenteron reissneri]|uniref:protein ILRUN isoform X1 n=1 Tax=Lethenteron reissneri TaxID=7753 RepID=UPI002AB6469E|nr:protein ILRUN isoform X1 [Lethenteron reissneri]
MDCDMDVDQELMQKFSCMGTTDKDVLISEFQKLLGFQLNPAGCAFFLDMANWNLQAAIGAYYDFETPNIVTPCMSFIKDVTIGEGESIPPNTIFTKTWRIQNSGTECWPAGVVLKFVNGHQFGPVSCVPVQALEPQHMADVSVDMTSPGPPAMYQGQWRMCTANGLFFGDVIWVIISVEVGGVLGVTQQLSTFGAELSAQHSAVQPDFNPFASPHKEEQPQDNQESCHQNLFGRQTLNNSEAVFFQNAWSPTGIDCDQDSKSNELVQNTQLKIQKIHLEDVTNSADCHPLHTAPCNLNCCNEPEGFGKS